MTDSATTVAVLYPGELGSALARLLAARGHRVVTTLAGRSPRTGRICRSADIEVLGSLQEVAQVADIVFSTVVPAAASRVAAAYGACRPAVDRALYVDLNSISPMAAADIAARLADVQVACVDGSIHGLAAQLQQRGTLYLSGDQADRVAALFDGDLRTRRLGSAAGAASGFKMMLGGVSKGLVGLFLELSLLARTAGVLDELLPELDNYYPGVMTVIQRLLPTYPLHARRRGDELAEVQRTMRHYGLEANMVQAAQRLIAAIGEMQLPEHPPESDCWQIRDVVEQVHRRQPLRRARDDHPRAAAQLPETAYSNSPS